MFGEKILDYWDDILRDLKEIIAVPSVAVPQAGPYPFGKDAAAASTRRWSSARAMI